MNSNDLIMEAANILKKYDVGRADYEKLIPIYELMAAVTVLRENGIDDDYYEQLLGNQP